MPTLLEFTRVKLPKHYSFLAWKHIEWTKYHIAITKDLSKVMCGARPGKRDLLDLGGTPNFKEVCANCVANLRKLV